MRRSAKVASLAAVLVALSLSGGAGDAAGRPHNKPRTYTTDVAGGWVQAGCVPVEPPMLAAATHFSLVCEMAYSGTWTAKVIEFIEGDIARDGSFSGTNDYYVGGRAAADNTCGWLHAREHVTSEAPPIGASRGTGEILSGTADWKGSSGVALIAGSVLGGAGVGGYSGTWTRPVRHRAAGGVPCTPGPPPPEVTYRLAQLGWVTQPVGGVSERPPVLAAVSARR